MRHLKIFIRHAMLIGLVLLGSREGFSQYRNVKINLSNNSPEETSIAINPVNPDNIIAGSNLKNYYVSTNGGSNWTEATLPGSYVYGDDAITFDHRGYCHFIHIGPFGHSGIYAQRSTNNGQSWRTGGVALVEHTSSVPFEDKAWPTADLSPSSPYQGNLYVTWTRFSNYGSSNPLDSSIILFSKSTDAGTTWSVPKRLDAVKGDAIDSDNTVEGAMTGVDASGNLTVVWAGPLGLVATRSTDAGNTWSANQTIGSIGGGWDYDVPGIYRCNGLPVTACDISPTSPYKNSIYVNWTDQRNGASDTDVWLIKSTNGGQSWSPPKRVNDDTTANRQQFFSWMSVNPVNGFIDVVFYDRRNYPIGSTLTDVYWAHSENGGETFVNTKISSSPFTPTTGVFFGDYTGISSYGSRVRPVWTRLDGSVLSVYTAIIDSVGLVKTSEPSREPKSFVLEQNYPNPFNPTTVISYQLSVSSHTSLKVFDVLGREVATLVNEPETAGRHEVRFDASKLSSGTYFYKLVSGTSQAVRRMVLVK